MTRHLRTRRNTSSADDDDDLDTTKEIKDENGIIHTTSRSLRKVNYAEIEHSYDFMDEDEDDDDEQIVRRPRRRTTHEHESHRKSPEDVRKGLYEETQPISETPRQSPRRKARHASDDEDESFHEEDIEDDNEVDEDADDEYFSEDSVKRRRREADRNFIEQDDDNEDDASANQDEEYGARRTRTRSSSRKSRRGRPSKRDSLSPPRKLRATTRRTRSAFFEDNEDRPEGPLTLEQELKELREDSPIREKRSLRERTKPVNYAIPPPLSETTMDDLFPKGPQPTTSSFQSPGRRRNLHNGQSFGPIRRLFPTGGPFGGNDVTTIFGTNTNFYTSAENNNNKLIMDSDSSEDEILPLGAKPTPKHNENLKKKKKKPEIADLDPLGVDMNISFDNVGGLDNYIDQLKEMVALPLLYPELYQNFNITPPRGVLFHGPPGTGKTLMARALAASCSTEQRKITFFMRKGADILSKWVGEAERQLRLLFEEAKKHQPSIIFFDEIDGLAPVRSSKQEQIHASIVSTMLALMDGMDNRGQVIVIGATNRPDAVDPALRRPGRFDREFYFPLPDLKARSKILQIHTKEWKPPLSQVFVEKLASLTKGYGGADLRALCTEAALISIQRKFPQIYQSNLKLSIDPKDVKVKARDFMIALDKIIPSSARSTGNIAQPLPQNVEVLLDEQFKEVTEKLDNLLPQDSRRLTSGVSLIKHYLEYEDDEDNDEGNDSLGFTKQEFLNRIEKSRVCNPRLLVSGPCGNGQQYIGSAILHYLEDYNIQMLDLGNLVSESTRTMESTVVQTFVEARRRQPSVIFIPNIEIWVRVVPETTILTLTSLFKSLRTNEKVLLVGIADGLQDTDSIHGDIVRLGFSKNIIEIKEPSSNQRYRYFQTIGDFLRMKPSKFQENKRRKKPLPKLPVSEIPNCGDGDVDEEGRPLSEDAKLRKQLKSHQHQDMKLKNTLKIKLSGLMDLFKNRYKRFRKPPVDDAFLVHLFEPEGYQQANPDWQPTYIKDDGMILEVATGKKFFNMDLDIVEERLWNGFYSEPKQFLKDIELIYRDAATMGDRERVIKASEMFANAQMGIEEISSPEFIQECKITRQRDILRQELFLKDEKERILKEQELQNQRLQEEKQELESQEVATQLASEKELGIGAGQQLQSQSQLDVEATSDLTPIPDITPSELPNGTAKNQVFTTMTEVGMVVQQESEDQDSRFKNAALPEYLKTQSLNHHIFREGQAEFKGSADREQAKGLEQKSEEELRQVSEQELEQNPDRKSKRESEQEQEQEQGSEQEPEQEPEFIVDNEQIDKIISQLEAHTKDYTVEQLEQLYASVLEIAWKDRFSWDKTFTLKKITQYLAL